MNDLNTLTATARSPAYALTMKPLLSKVSPAAEGRAIDGMSPASTQWRSHRLHFASLIQPGRALSFPCNRRGEVQLDGLSERDRNNYFFARTTVGRDYGAPIVIAPEVDLIH